VYSSRIGAVSSMTHDDVFVPADLTVLRLALVVVMALGVQRQLLIAPANAISLFYKRNLIVIKSRNSAVAVIAVIADRTAYDDRYAGKLSNRFQLAYKLT